MYRAKVGKFWSIQKNYCDYTLASRHKQFIPEKNCPVKILVQLAKKKTQLILFPPMSAVNGIK